MMGFIISCSPEIKNNHAFCLEYKPLLNTGKENFEKIDRINRRRITKNEASYREICL